MIKQHLPITRTCYFIILAFILINNTGESLKSSYGQCLLSEEDTGYTRKCESICVQKLKQRNYTDVKDIVRDNYADQYQDQCRNVTGASMEDYEWVCEVRAAVLLPNNTDYDAARPKVLPVLELAVQNAYEMELIPKFVKWKFIHRDDACDSTRAQAAASVAVSRYCTHVLFGPACDYALASVARIIKYEHTYGIPLLTVGGLTFDFSEKKTECKDEYYMLVRTGTVGFRDYAFFVMDLMKRHNWRKVLAIYEVAGQSHVAGKHTCHLMMKTLVEYLKKDTNLTFSAWDTSQNAHNTIKENLKIEMGMSYTVAVLCASPNTIREIMLAADDLNMVNSGEYVFFNIELYTSMTSASLKPWYNPLDTEENNVRARRAYEALLTVTAQTPDDQQYREFSQQVKSLSKSKYNYTFDEQEPLSTFVTAFYDAVTLYARSLNASLNDNTSSSAGTEPNYEALARPLNGSDITRRMRNTKFKGITGDVIIDSNGDRLSDYSLMDMNPETGMFEVVANYIASSRALEFVPGKSIHWPGNRQSPPLDSPVCGFDMSLCPDNSLPGYGILSIILSAVLLIVLVVAVLLYRRYRNEADLLSMSWMVDYRDIIQIPTDNSRHPMRGSLLTLAAVVNSPDVLNNCAEPFYGNNSAVAGASGLLRRGSQITAFSQDLKNQNSGRQLFFEVAMYKGVRVAQKRLTARIELTRDLSIELRLMKHLSHDHLTRFYGACLDSPEGDCLLLTEYCPRGSLKDILENDQLELDWMFRISLMQDIVRGMCYLHNSDIKSHGSLKSSNCVVDSRFVLKITDFGLRALRNPATCCLDNSGCEEKKTRTEVGALTRRYKNKIVSSYKWRNKNYIRNSVNSAKLRKDKPGVTDIKDGTPGSTPKRQNGSLSTECETSNCNDGNDKKSPDYWKKFLWTAPELLRMDSTKRPPEGTQKGDVYSFGIIVHEIVTRKGAFFREDFMPAKEIVEGVRRGPKNSSLGSSPGSPNPLGSVSPNNFHHNHNSGANSQQQQHMMLIRPSIVEGTEQQLTEVMNHCWSEDPNNRPDFNSLKSTVRRLNKDQESGNILDNLLSRMEQYANNLETLVEERTRDYFEEKRKCEELLYQLLPKSVASQLISGGAVAAETYDEVTVYFSDIVGFTKMSAESTPMEVVDLLNDLYSCFDSIIENFDVYKVETIGDAYMVVSGLPARNGSRHASEIARMALALLSAVDKFTIRHRPHEKLLLRIGIHTGPCVAGVVGRVMPRYCLFGDTVNTASRMESHGEPLKIHVSPFTKRLLDIMGGFLLQERGEVSMKGKPPMITYWLKGEVPVAPSTAVDTKPIEIKTDQTKFNPKNPDVNKPENLCCDLEFFSKDDDFCCEVEIHDETCLKNKNSKTVTFPGLTTPEIVCSAPSDDNIFKIKNYGANKTQQSRKEFFEDNLKQESLELQNIKIDTGQYSGACCAIGQDKRTEDEVNFAETHSILKNKISLNNNNNNLKKAQVKDESARPLLDK